MNIRFPAHAEPLMRQAILSVMERIPQGQDVPMLELLIVPVDHITPAPLRFTMDEVEADETPRLV